MTSEGRPRLALLGCTEAEIATLTGHSLRDVHAILDIHYLSRDRALAENAIRKLEGGCRHRAGGTAATLDIAATTAKSHLENIFTKTGVSRQADLMRLATSLAPPTVDD